MKSIRVRSYSIRTLQRLFEKKIFAIPELQREFVWNIKKACMLMDSIYRNYPIGTAMVWETQRDNQNLLRKSLHVLPQFDAFRNKSLYVLVDGQQRLSVLYQVVHGNIIRNADGKQVDFGRIYFALNSTSDSHFIHLKRHDPDVHVRLCEILSPRWRKLLGHLPKYKVHEVYKCRQQILGYKCHIVFARTNEIEDVRDTFIRINSLGTPIRSADRAFARAVKVDLRHLVNEARHGLQRGFDQLAPETLLNTMALAHGAGDLGERAVNSLMNKLDRSEQLRRKFDRDWRYIKGAIGMAVDHLVQNFGVLNLGFLPSQNMVTTLALFFFFNRCSQPNSVQRMQIKKWFWATAVGQRYTGRGFRRNIMEDGRFFKRMAEKHTARFDVKEMVPQAVLKLTDYSQKSVVADAFLCLLIVQRPRYIDVGEPILLDDSSSRANRGDKHHIFPKALLARHGFGKREYNTICNICFVVARENQSIGSKRPALYLDRLRRKKHFARAMISHLIPYEKDSPLWAGNIAKGFRDFVKLRQKQIAKAFELQAGTKLFALD